MYRDLRLPVDIDHLAVLPSRNREIELQTDPFGALTHGIARLPSEVIDRPDQNIAQCAVFAVDAPCVERAGTAPLDSCAQLHCEISPHGTGVARGCPLSTIQADTAVPPSPSGAATRLCIAPRGLKKLSPALSHRSGCPRILSIKVPLRT